MTPGVKPKPLLLSLVTESPQAARLAEDICEVVQAADHGDRKAAITRFGPRVQAVLTHGVHGLTAAEMDRMPRLSIVCSMGAAWRTSTCAPPAAGASRSARGPARTPPPRRT
ncbi:MAG TPA: hypothetical protein VEA40_27395, partial [Ramlibacter sp.]|nr:hypothetical protein [Ramlibacter sp.]